MFNILILAKTTKIDLLRFTDEDLHIIGTLEYGQFAVTPTHLNLVMDYAEGGTLWDILESSPLDGKISEQDIKWWTPQIINAIAWCHSQDFVHRDIKPHNFVLKSDAHLMLIDFGSAAPLLRPHSDGSQQVPKRHCLVPCGTCDYISPEILRAHEAALVALEMSGEPDDDSRDDVTGGYGRETDWWSLGAMLYEMVYGIAPFFAKDIKQTYLKITDHTSSSVSSPGIALVRNTPSQQSSRSILREQSVASFIGFSWGPAMEAFKSENAAGSEGPSVRQDTVNTPRPLRYTSVPLTPYTFIPPTPGIDSLKATATPRPYQLQPFATPIRPNMMSPYGTLPRASTIRRTAPRRAVSDREAMKQLVDCVGMSARKKVLESGRKPKVLGKFNFGSGSKSNSTLKELRFDRSVMVMNDDMGISFRLDPPASASTSASGSMLTSLGASTGMNVSQSNHSHSHSQSQSQSTSILSRASRDLNNINTSFLVPSESDTSTETDIPPSPSPSPRPGSAMSMLSRRSQTPTISGSYLRINATAGSRTLDTMKSNFLSPLSPIDPAWRQAAASDDEDVAERSGLQLQDNVWDDLQRRHSTLMRDIAHLDIRLAGVVAQ
ncbi:hypothetical protein EUX98_g8966, partial [Antrodiella citrinella]